MILDVKKLENEEVMSYTAKKLPRLKTRTRYILVGSDFSQQ